MLLFLFVEGSVALLLDILFSVEESVALLTVFLDEEMVVLLPPFLNEELVVWPVSMARVFSLSVRLHVYISVS